MKVLGSSPAAKWIVPMELTSLVQGIAGTFAAPGTPGVAGPQ
jgi:hypothetical protein